MTEVPKGSMSLGAMISLVESMDEPQHRSQIIDLAQWFVDHDFEVVPAKGKTPIGGVYTAKKDTKGITDGYGIAARDKYIFIDYDLHDGALPVPPESFETTTWLSGSGEGYGIIYEIPEELNGFAGKDPDLVGVMYRGCGSILIGPGSKHPSGGTYKFISQIKPAKAQDWVIKGLTKLKESKEKETEILCGQAVKPDRFFTDKKWTDYLEAQIVDDRSRATAAILFYSAQKGATNEELAWIISNYKPAIDKGNVSKHLARLLTQIRLEHDHPGKPCDAADCPNNKWMKKKPVSAKETNKKQTSINLLVEPFSNMKKEIFAWYDEPWIPQIGLALVAGPSGAGKSTYLVYQIAKLTRQKVKCLYLGTREQDGSRIRAQLEAANADLEYVFSAMMEETHEDMTFKTEVQFKRDLDILSKVIVEHDIKAVFLDPGNSYIGISEGNDTSGALRLHLERLKRLCEDLKITIVFLKHTKKQQKDDGNIPIGDMIYGDTVWKEVPRINTMLWPVKDKLRERLELADDDPTNVLLLVAEGHNYADKNHPAAQFHLHAVFDSDLQTKVTKIDYLGCKAITTSEIDEKKGQSDKEAKESKKAAHEIDEWLIKTLKPHREKGLSTEVLRKLASKESFTWNNVKVRVNRNTVEIEKIPIEGSNEIIWKLPLITL